MHMQWQTLILAIALGLSALLAPVVTPAYAQNSDQNQERVSQNWLDQGWQLLNNHQTEQAMSVWQQGLNTLPDEQLLGSLGLFSSLENAIDRLRLAGQHERAFMLHDPIHSEMYHVLTAQSVVEDIALRQIQLAALKHKLNIRGKIYANSAIKFKSQALPAQTASETISAASPAEANQTVQSIPDALNHSLQPWVEQGWQSLSRKEYGDALSLWQHGINAISPSAPVIVAGAFSQLGNAIDRARTIGKSLPAMVIRPYSLYFVLALPPEEKISASELQQITGIKEKPYITQNARFISPPFGKDHFAGIQLYTPIAKRQQADEQVSDSASADGFTINRFQISGNKLLPTDLILITLRDYYSGERSDLDLDQIRRDVIALYEMSGYPRVKVLPPQHLDWETVGIDIDEAKISR